MLGLDNQRKNLSNLMNMDIQRYCANARSLPVCNALYGSSTVRRELEPLRPSPNAVLREQGQKCRSLPGCNALYDSSTVIRKLEPLHPRPNVVLNRQGLPHSNGRGRLKKLVHEAKIRFGSWNIGTLNGKSFEVAQVMSKRKINILCLQETRWAGEKSKEIKVNGSKLWYTGKVNGRNGVGIIADKDWKKNVVGVKRIEDRIISLKVIVGKDTMNIISAYAPQVGAETHLKDKFWADMEELIQGIPTTERIFIGGDLNGHVGKEAGAYARAHGGFGFGELNDEGKTIIDFSLAYNLRIVNTCFRKRDEHLITYKSGTHRSQIDFFLARNQDRRLCTNCKVIPGHGVTTQHRLLVLDVQIKGIRSKRRTIPNPKIKWWQLKGEKRETFKRKLLLEEGVWESQESANIMWKNMAKKVEIVAKEILGESKGFGPRDKETWWWNEDVQEKVRNKKNCFKAIHLCNSAENWEKYRLARKEAKKVVSEARAKAYEGFYKELGTKAGEQKIYKRGSQKIWIK